MEAEILKVANEHREAKQQYDMLAAQNSYGLGEESANALNESYWLAWARMKQAEAEMLRIAQVGRLCAMGNMPKSDYGESPPNAPTTAYR